MMHGHEKSDPAIVAVKLANKAEPSAERSAGEPSAAEPVERRAGTKGNAGQQSTRRTQSRVHCSPAVTVATSPRLESELYRKGCSSSGTQRLADRINRRCSRHQIARNHLWRESPFMKEPALLSSVGLLG
jgi:hypothetical protein